LIQANQEMNESSKRLQEEITNRERSIEDLENKISCLKKKQVKLDAKICQTELIVKRLITD